MLFLLLAAAVDPIQPGRWEKTITAVDLVIPGAPGFLLRMARGKAKTETQCIAPADATKGAAVLIVPPPKSMCRFDRQGTGGGKVDQLLACPQKDGGDPLHIASTGSYTPARLTARIVMTRTTPRGAMRVTADQVSVWKGACGK